MYLQTLSNSKIRYYKNTTQLGSPENWNQAIRMSVANLVKIMHHDDWFTHEKSLQIFYDLMHDSKFSLAFVASRNYHLDNKSVISINMPGMDVVSQIEYNPLLLIKGNYIGAPSATIFRKSDILFDSKLIWLVDIDFYISLLLRNGKLNYSTNDAITIGISNSQITTHVINDEKINIFEFFYLLNKYSIIRVFNSEFHENVQKLILRFNLKFITDITKHYQYELPKDIRLYFGWNYKIKYVLHKFRYRLSSFLSIKNPRL